MTLLAINYEMNFIIELTSLRVRNLEFEHCWYSILNMIERSWEMKLCAFSTNPSIEKLTPNILAPQ